LQKSEKIRKNQKFYFLLIIKFLKLEEDWSDFFQNFPNLDASKQRNLRGIFKKNLRYYPWNRDEDDLLKDIIT